MNLSRRGFFKATVGAVVAAAAAPLLPVPIPPGIRGVVDPGPMTITYGGRLFLANEHCPYNYLLVMDKNTAAAYRRLVASDRRYS